MRRTRWVELLQRCEVLEWLEAGDLRSPQAELLQRGEALERLEAGHVRSRQIELLQRGEALECSKLENSIPVRSSSWSAVRLLSGSRSEIFNGWSSW